MHGLTATTLLNKYFTLTLTILQIVVKLVCKVYILYSKKQHGMFLKKNMFGRHYITVDH